MYEISEVGPEIKFVSPLKLSNISYGIFNVYGLNNLVKYLTTKFHDPVLSLNKPFSSKVETIKNFFTDSFLQNLFLEGEIAKGHVKPSDYERCDGPLADKETKPPSGLGGTRG